MYTSVLIVDKAIDHAGIVSNVSLVMGLTAGRLLPGSTFGEDVFDGDGNRHRFLTNTNHYIRKAGQNKLRALRAFFADMPDTIVVDYTEDAAANDYAIYTNSLSANSGEGITYRAIYIFGPTDTVYPKTKNLSALS